MSSSRAHAALVAWRASFISITPALLTTPSSRPKCATVAATASPTLLSEPTSQRTAKGAPAAGVDAAGGHLRCFEVQVCERDRSARLDERLGDPRAEAPGGAGHQVDAVAELHRVTRWCW